MIKKDRYTLLIWYATGITNRKTRPQCVSLCIFIVYFKIFRERNTERKKTKKQIKNKKKKNKQQQKKKKRKKKKIMSLHPFSMRSKHILRDFLLFAKEITHLKESNITKFSVVCYVRYRIKHAVLLLLHAHYYKFQFI
jgi:agmatine/peptidylarginine deiminase